MWFFQQLPALSPTAFEAALQEMDAGKEIKILSRQIQMLSFNVINKHLWFNRGYGALVMGLLCLIAVVATYVLRLYLGIDQRFSWPLLVVSVGIVTIALLVYYTLAVTERKQETMFQARFSAGTHGVDTGA